MRWPARRDSNPDLLLRRQLLYPVELRAACAGADADHTRKPLGLALTGSEEPSRAPPAAGNGRQNPAAPPTSTLKGKSFARTHPSSAAHSSQAGGCRVWQQIHVRRALGPPPRDPNTRTRAPGTAASTMRGGFAALGWAERKGGNRAGAHESACSRATARSSACSNARASWLNAPMAAATPRRLGLIVGCGWWHCAWHASGIKACGSLQQPGIRPQPHKVIERQNP